MVIGVVGEEQSTVNPRAPEGVSKKSLSTAVSGGSSWKTSTWGEPKAGGQEFKTNWST